MGSCISKCNPQKYPQEEFVKECVKDKLVISQAPISPRIPLPSFSSSTIKPRKLISSSPSSSASSSSSSVSLSSFSSTATNVTLSSSLSSSSSSSSFKDRSFSNDFLLSCAQEHDHILEIKKNKATNTSTMSTSGKKYARSSSSTSTLSKPPSPRRESNSTTTPKKRPRANSPIMVRQKSFRKEPDQQLMIKGGNIGNNGNTLSITSTYHHHFPSTRATLKSPSPSRRFPSNSNGDKKESSFRKPIASKGNNGSVLSRSSSLRRENHFTPKNEGKMRNVLPVSPKIDEMEIGEEMKSSDQDLDSFLMEDINNPLIALDCFIFL